MRPAVNVRPGLEASKRTAVGDGAETDYLADVLLAPLAADVFIYQREARGMSVSELTDSWTALATALVTGWPPAI